MFIVLEGLDGAGKSTQIKKLRDMFAEQGIPSEYIHFPRFDAPYFGDMIARFLRGEFGSVDQVDPYIVAMLYAEDRRDASSLIKGWMDQGKVVIADRYVYSNIGYQCAKVEDEAEREKLREWIFSLEYDYFKIPRPDVSLFPYVPTGSGSGRGCGHCQPRRRGLRRSRTSNPYLPPTQIWSFA